MKALKLDKLFWVGGGLIHNLNDLKRSDRSELNDAGVTLT